MSSSATENSSEIDPNMLWKSENLSHMHFYMQLVGFEPTISPFTLLLKWNEVSFRLELIGKVFLSPRSNWKKERKRRINVYMYRA
jgi:hypothetical protein